MKKLVAVLFALAIGLSIFIADTSTTRAESGQVVPKTKKIYHKSYRKGHHITVTSYRHGRKISKKSWKKGKHIGQKTGRKTKHIVVVEPKRRTP